ncbi:sensor histidine kinase [Streptomyces sp. NPDC088116]|uniref:sensor histidine kinase n=1 Tax=Streptomyces sp. NPDC088116 TaxID=3365825 RepID=UPI00382E5E45
MRRTTLKHVAGRRWSLRTRLVVSAVMLIAVVGTVIGAVTTIAFRSYLYDQLDTQVSDIAKRAGGPPQGSIRDGVGPGGSLPQGKDPLRIVTSGGTPLGTLGAAVSDDGSVGRGLISTRKTEDSVTDVEETPLTKAQTAALATVPRDTSPHTVRLPGDDNTDYRVTYISGINGDFLVGVPLTEVQNNLNTLVIVEICVTLAGVIAAGIAGGALVGVALRPLSRVAHTATRVSELPLHTGEVAPLERVPAAEADSRTEIGQVGAALNRMLGHVGSALASRQESETRVRQFVADAGHELRTPLASIRGYAELTRRGREETGPDTRHALGRIEAEAERMTGLVEDLLLLARLDAGRPLSYESTDLSPLVVDAVSDAHAAGQSHHWRLELPEPDQPAAVVHGDGSRLHQVLVNLLGNARTHTPPGTTVTARVRRSDGGARNGWSSNGFSSAGSLSAGSLSAGSPTVGSLSAGSPYVGSLSVGSLPVDSPSVVLEVQDDGPGIPPTLLPHVFERFARGDASRSRAAGSTGLGLAIVQAVVTAHGGTVDVQSVPGRTVFSVRLPIPPEQHQLPEQHQHQHQHQMHAQHDLHAQHQLHARQPGPAPEPEAFGEAFGDDSQTGHSVTTRP